MKPKHPPGDPMTLGNMRESRGVSPHRLLPVKRKRFEYEPARNTRLEDVGRKGARFHLHALLD
jgi:hypothetical protein